MKYTKSLNLRLWLPVLVLVVATIGGIYNLSRPHKVYAATPSASNPCPGNPAPAQWKHVIVLMFENKTYSQVIGSSVASTAPFINNLVSKCGTSINGPTGTSSKNNWLDSNYNVDGSTNGNYPSKPSYALLTNGLPATTTNIKDDSYGTTTSVDNIYNRLNGAGISAKDYYDGSASSSPCSNSGNFSGSYHDAMRYYTDLGGQSSTTTTYCNTHDVPLTNFMTDVNNNTLPAFSMVLPTNGENMHDNSISSGDTWANNFLTPLLNSARYQSGDTAIFFLWDEEASVPNVLIAPSIKPGSAVQAPTGNPISHYAALRTFQEMLGVTPLLGNTSQAPSLLTFFNGGSTQPPPVDNPPAVSITAPTSGSTITTSPVSVTTNPTDDIGITKVEFYVNGTLTGTDTTTPYSFSWDTSALSGSQTLTAKAYDTGGHVTTSSAVTVTVSIPSGCTVPPTTFGTATTIINAPSGTTYHAWSRLNAPDTTNNSYYLQVDAACPVVIGDSASLAANTWTWVNYHDGITSNTVNVALSSGNHTVTLIGREPGVKLDRVLFLSDTCVPSGTGANCVDSTAPTVSLTSPTNGQSVHGTVTLAANATDEAGGSGISKVDFLVDNNVVGTALSLAYQINWNSGSVPVGTHVVTAKATDVAGNIGTSAANTVTVTAGTPGSGDLDGDGHVTISDLSILVSHFGQSSTGVIGDVNGDGTVNIVDLSILLSHYGT